MTRWSQFRGGIEELEERTDNEQLTDWAARLEEEMRPPLARLGDHLGTWWTGWWAALRREGSFSRPLWTRGTGRVWLLETIAWV